LVISPTDEGKFFASYHVEDIKSQLLIAGFSLSGTFLGLCKFGKTANWCSFNRVVRHQNRQSPDERDYEEIDI
jgi:hypothetical protein